MAITQPARTALSLTVALVVAVAAYALGGGRGYPLAVDLVVVAVIGLVAGTGTAHLILRTQHRR